MHESELEIKTGNRAIAQKMIECGRSQKPFELCGVNYLITGVSREIGASTVAIGATMRQVVLPEWGGEGLPPAGLAVEFSLNRGKVDWATGVVIGQDGPCQVVIKYGSEYHARNIHGVRPIKTAEQIAAEEREAAITAAYKFVSDWPNEIAVKSIIGKLYDAGFIQQEEKQ